MSFILDALRKVDQENRQSGEVVPPVVAVERLRKERRNRRRQFAAMGVIGVISAAATAVLLRRPPEPAPQAAESKAPPVDVVVASPIVPIVPIVEAELPDTNEVVPERAPAPAPPAKKREAPRESERTAPVPPATEPETELPRLVLQGTSVLNGKPVAVVSDRRVFVGDTIEGAVVVLIEERSVTLEFEGRRFTLTL
ncbi:MAG TPA: hypothetical protein VIE88_07980 [Vicinamibacteria bacterium]|jgi:hypothetical protein